MALYFWWKTRKRNWNESQDKLFFSKHAISKYHQWDILPHTCEITLLVMNQNWLEISSRSDFETQIIATTPSQEAHSVFSKKQCMYFHDIVQQHPPFFWAAAFCFSSSFRVSKPFLAIASKTWELWWSLSRMVNSNNHVVKVLVK